MPKGDRLLKATRPRVVLPVSGGVWTAAAILHAARVGPLDPALVTAAAAGITWGSRARPFAGTVAVTGAWVMWATATGPLAGPGHLVSWLWAGFTVTGLAVIHRHEAVRAAKDWRHARMEWLHKAGLYGLHNSHLIHHERTRLGEMFELDIRGTGKRASRVPGSDLAERVAEDKGLPVSRVRVTQGSIAGRVRVSIRYKDPWAHPIPHPVLDGSPEIKLAVPCTIREPLAVGQDPETGKPLTLTLWDERGAKTVMVVAMLEGGKTVLLNCLRERITAAADADLWNINLSKSVEDRDWEPACEYSACGPEAFKKAAAILKRARALINERGAAHRDDTVFQPTEKDRAKAVVVDEIDALVAAHPQVKDDLSYIASKGRSEAVILVIAGQRATANWIGGANVRANIRYVAVGRVRNPGEVNHAVGHLIGAQLPDMSTYGEGQPGVWTIADAGGAHQAGRTFHLRELTDLRKIVAGRVFARELVTAGNLPASNLPVSNTDPAAPPPPTPAPVPEAPAVTPGQPTTGGGGSDPLADLGAEIMSDLPDDLREQLGKISFRNAQAAKIVEETNRSNPPVSPDPDAMAASAAERWKQVAEQATIPADLQPRLLDLLSGDGTTIKEVRTEFGISHWTARTWLEKLRGAGTVETTGQKRGTRWRLTRGDTP